MAKLTAFPSEVAVGLVECTFVPKHNFFSRTVELSNILLPLTGYQGSSVADI